MLKEDQYEIYKDGEAFVMFHVAHGVLWETGSDDPKSFDMNDATEIPQEEYEQFKVGKELIKTNVRRKKKV